MTNSKTVSMKIYFVELSVDCECPKSKGNISPGDCLSNSSRKAVESSNQAIDSPRWTALSDSRLLSSTED